MGGSGALGSTLASTPDVHAHTQTHTRAMRPRSAMVGRLRAKLKPARDKARLRGWAQRTAGVAPSYAYLKMRSLARNRLKGSSPPVTKSGSLMQLQHQVNCVEVTTDEGMLTPG